MVTAALVPSQAEAVHSGKFADPLHSSGARVVLTVTADVVRSRVEATN
jgi:hypothetical protein